MQQTAAQYPPPYPNTATSYFILLGNNKKQEIHQPAGKKIIHKYVTT
jgi:hypothetical protein